MREVTVLLGSVSVMYDNWLPYASGCLISHARKSPAVRERYRFLTPFYKYRPEEIEPLLLATDILGLTCYTWNQAVNDRIAARFKQIRPRGVAIYGGPNVPEDPLLFDAYARGRPFVDLHFCGMAEDSFRSFLENLETTAVHAHAGSFGLREDGRLFDNTDRASRQRQIDVEMPTPYLEGIFDPILVRDSALKASFETNRGCPYRCSYCDWGGQSRSKIRRFDPQKVKATTEFLFSQKNIREIEILDANFGIFESDLETVNVMAEQRERWGSPARVSYSGLAKNGSRYLPEVLSVITHRLGAQRRNIKLSFQSHSEDALKAMNRGNIDNSKLIDLLARVRGSHEVTSEMIIGMIGETPESWLATLEKDYTLGIDFMRPYILHVVPNTELYSAAYREKHAIQTRKIRFPYEMAGKDYAFLAANPGWRATPSHECEEIEIVSSCSSYDLAGLERMFDYWWFYHTFYNAKLLRRTLKTLVENGRTLSQIILDFFSALGPRHQTLHALVSKNRKIVADIFDPRRTQTILDLETYFFFSRCLRSDELLRIRREKELFASELLDIFGTAAQVAVEEDLSSVDRKSRDADFYGLNASLG